MKKTFYLFIIAGLFFAACGEGAVGPKGEPGESEMHMLATDLEVTEIIIGVGESDASETSVILGLSKILTASVNEDALVKTVVWELYDESVGEILRLDRPDTVIPLSGIHDLPNNLMLSGNTVKVTGLIAGEARIVVTALGSGAIPLQKIITVKVDGVAAEFARLPVRLQLAPLTNVTINAHLFELIPPLELNYFDDDDSINAIKFTITLKSTHEVELVLSTPGSMFHVGKGIELVLEDINVLGIAGNNRPLITVNDYGKLTIKNTKITGNTNTSTQIFGGGIRVAPHGTLAIVDGEISGNRAERGGGIYNEGVFTMADGEISGNTAVIIGGGVFVINGGSFVINGGEIKNNSTLGFRIDERGGSVAVTGEGSTLTMNGGTVYGSSSYSGGGIFVQNDAFFTMNNGTILGNKSRSDGAGISVSFAEFEMKDGLVTGNESARAGGGINISASDFVMHNGTITNNKAESGAGGGINITTSGASTGNMPSTFIMHNGTVSGNSSKSSEASENGTGGGINVSGSTFTMMTGEVFKNTSTSYGGGISIVGTTLTQTDGTGILLQSSFAMENGKIYENASTGNLTGRGGGIHVNGSIFLMKNGEIYKNTSSLGGGVHLVNSGISTKSIPVEFTMKNGKIYENASSGTAGGVHVNGSNFIMEGGSIFDNTSELFGGGVNLVDGGQFSSYWPSTFVMHAGEIYGNTANCLRAVDNGGGGGVRLASAGALTVFEMRGGKIRDNVSQGVSNLGGGGVLALGTFTMYGGEITGNRSGVGGLASGGGIHLVGQTTASPPSPILSVLRIVNGTISGNTGTPGASLSIPSSYSEAGYGTFSGTNWLKAGDLITSDAPVIVANGVLQP